MNEENWALDIFPTALMIGALIIGFLLIPMLVMAYDYDCYTTDQIDILNNISITNNFTSSQNQSWFEIYGYLCELNINTTEIEDLKKEFEDFKNQTNQILRSYNFSDSINTVWMEMEDKLTEEDLINIRNDITNLETQINEKGTQDEISGLSTRVDELEVNKYFIPAVIVLVFVVIIVVYHFMVNKEKGAYPTPKFG